MQHIQEKLQLKAGYSCNVTTDGHEFKNLHLYERGGKGLQSFFKE